MIIGLILYVAICMVFTDSMFFPTVVVIIAETCRNNKTGIGMSFTCYFDGI